MNPLKATQFEPSTSSNGIKVVDRNVNNPSPDRSLSYENQNETVALESTSQGASIPQIRQGKIVKTEVSICTGREKTDATRSKPVEQKLIETRSYRGPSLELISAIGDSVGLVSNETPLDTTNAGPSTSRVIQRMDPVLKHLPVLNILSPGLLMLSGTNPSMSYIPDGTLSNDVATETIRNNKTACDTCCHGTKRCHPTEEPHQQKSKKSPRPKKRADRGKDDYFTS
jgi:hypothetical protein